MPYRGRRTRGWCAFPVVPRVCLSSIPHHVVRLEAQAYVGEVECCRACADPSSCSSAVPVYVRCGSHRRMHGIVVSLPAWYVSGSFQGPGILTIIDRHHQDPDAARDRQGPAWDRRNAQGDRRQGRVSRNARLYSSLLIAQSVLPGCTEVSFLP